MRGKYADAIESYERALSSRPDWEAAQENRVIAQARLDKLAPPEDDHGGTGGMLAADEIVFGDDRKGGTSQEIEVGQGDQLSDEELRRLWLRRVETKPADFLRAKFAYQRARLAATEGGE